MTTSTSGELDPRWEWEEVAFYGRPTMWVKGRCRHLTPLPVEDISGALVAHLCPDCDTQLPPEWTP